MGTTSNRIKKGKCASTKNSAIFAWASLTMAFLLAALVGSSIFAFCFQGTDKSQMVQAVNGKVSVPLQAVSDGKAHF
jgi:hypothetical protein